MVESNRSSPFTPEELSVVVAVANLVSISLQNVFHYKEQQHRQLEAEQRQRELAQREQSLALLNQITREALQARGFHSMIASINTKICYRCPLWWRRICGSFSGDYFTGSPASR